MAALLLIAAAVASAAAQTTSSDGRVRLIVQRDDLGVGHGVNEATLQWR